MRAPVRAALVGAAAALRVPLWLRGDRWTELLQPPRPAMPRRVPPDRALGAALLVLRALARLPGAPWRNTCLYRSVAHCLLLRRYGIPAVLRIGVRVDAATGAVLAHAWVVPDPAEEGPPPDSMLPFPVGGRPPTEWSMTG